MRRTPPDASTDRDQLLADAHALQRLSAYPEWAVLERLLDEHAARIAVELCQRGLDLVATEGLRAELAAVEWLRHRPQALQRAVDDLDALARRRRRQVVSGPEPFPTVRRQGGPDDSPQSRRPTPAPAPEPPAPPEPAPHRRRTGRRRAVRRFRPVRRDGVPALAGVPPSLDSLVGDAAPVTPRERNRPQAPRCEPVAGAPCYPRSPRLDAPEALGRAL